MRIIQLTPGTGHFYCGACLRDSGLVRALRARGNDALIVPLYLPLKLEDPTAPEAHADIRMGGINVYLQHKLRALRHMPRRLADALDRPGLLRWASTKGNMTDPRGLGSMTLSMLRGEEGRQAHELEKLIDVLQRQPAADVILLSNAMLIGMARRLKQALGVPVICSLQGEAPFLDALDAAHREQAWETLRERAVDIDAFVPVSRWYGDLLADRLGLAPDRVHVVHNGIDPTDLAAVDWRAPAVPTVGYLARMCADKGLPTLVEAFVHLVRSGEHEPDLRLRIAGVELAEDRPLVRSLRRRLADEGLQSRVDFLPNLEREQKIEFLGSLSVLSVPATYGESFGLYLLEALAAGVPLVQPRHGAFPEILEATGGGLLCEPDDPVDLARALGELLSDERTAREFAERGRSVVLERFTEDVMAEGVEAVCKMVAAR